MTLSQANDSNAPTSLTTTKTIRRIAGCSIVSFAVATIFGLIVAAPVFLISALVFVAPGVYRADRICVMAFRLERGDTEPGDTKPAGPSKKVPPERLWMRSQKTLFVMVTMLCVLTIVASSSWTGVEFFLALLLGGAALLLGVWAVLLIARLWVGLAAGRTDRWKQRLALWAVLPILTALVGLASGWTRSVRFAATRDGFDQTAMVLLNACQAEGRGINEVRERPDYFEPFALRSIPRTDAPVDVKEVQCRPGGFRFTSGRWSDFLSGGDWGFSYPDEEILDYGTFEHLAGGWYLWKTDLS